jgi:hypothetical protein
MIFIGAQNKEDVLNSYKVHVGAPFVFSGTFDILNPEINDDIIAGCRRRIELEISRWSV